MKRLFDVILFLLFLNLSRGQDSLQIKKVEILDKLKTSFSGDWSLNVLDSSVVFKREMVLNLPPAVMRLNVYHSKSSTDTFTIYFFKFQEKDTVINRILTGFSYNHASDKIEYARDTSHAEYDFPLLNSDLTWFVTTFNVTGKNVEELEMKLNQLSDFTPDEVKITDVQQEEKDEPPPPPPPPKKKKKKNY
jgi:hypothetical protein